MLSFAIATGLIFLAELGDKSQLVSLWFATRYRWWVVLSGLAVAALALNLVAALVGTAFGELVPGRPLAIAVGAAFIAFGLWAIHEARSVGEAEPEAEAATIPTRRLGPFGIVAATFFLSELGDKTQLATLSLASERSEPVAVWLGSATGMVLANGLAVAIGLLAGRRLPRRAIAWGAALLFIGFGLATLALAFR